MSNRKEGCKCDCKFWATRKASVQRARSLTRFCQSDVRSGRRSMCLNNPYSLSRTALGILLSGKLLRLLEVLRKYLPRFLSEITQASFSHAYKKVIAERVRSDKLITSPKHFAPKTFLERSCTVGLLSNVFWRFYFFCT